MITLDQLNDAIDPATGTLRLTLPLATLPDTAGPPFALAAAYAGPTPGAVYQWNLDAPTGVLGLGWTLNVMRIFALQPVGSATPTAYYLDTGTAVIPLLRLSTQADGTQTFGRFDGAFWSIRYDAGAQRWLLIDENGVRFVFGSAGTDAVDTQIAWSAWTGASILVPGQASVATVWRLAQIQDLWGNTTEFDYARTSSTVGAGVDTYTQAAYLSKVTGAGGGSLVLNYQDKTTNEYQPAHTAPPAPNAWQCCYETKYLQSISVLSPTGKTLQTIGFSYSSLGSGQLTKRLLTGVQTGAPAGRSSPGTVFAWGLTGAGTDPSYAQITQITTPEGGVAQISYATATPALSNRSAVLAAPSGSVTYANPLLTLADDYAVTTWRSSDNSKIAVTACTWDGRWVPTTLAVLTSTVSSAVQTATAIQSFVVRVDAQLMPYRRDPTQAGAWSGPASALPISLTGSEQAATACTDSVAAALGLTSLKLTAAVWNGSSWSARAAQTLQGGESSPIAALAASTARLVAAVVDGSNASSPVTVYLMGVDDTRQWSSASVTLTRPSAAIDAISVQVGPTFAVIRSSGLAGGFRTVTFDLVDWAAATVRTQRLTQLVITPSAALPTAAVHGASIEIGQLLFRYNGAQWQTQDVESLVPSGAGALTNLSPGTDVLVRSFAATAGGSVFDVVAYDPNSTSAVSAWSSVLQGTLPAGAYTASAAVTKNPPSQYIVFARPAGQGGNPAAANAVYYRMPNGQWSHAFDIPDTLTQAECASLRVVGGRYLAYQSGANVIAYPLANGAVSAAARTVLNGQALLIPNADPTTLLAPSFFATYSGTWGTGSTLSLHSVTLSGADATQSCVVASRLRRLNGNTIDPTTGYAAVDATPTYEVGSAVVSPSGEFARFNRTTLTQTAVSGGASCGSVMAELFNGLTSAEVAALPAALNPNYPSGALTNAAQFARVLVGSPYRSTQSWTASGSAKSNVSTTFLNVTVRHFLPSGNPAGDPLGYCARAMQTQTVNDGVTMTVTTTLNANLLPQTVSSTRFDGSGNVETIATTYSYFPDQYAASGPENLLTPVIQSQTTSNGTAVQATVTTWSGSWGGTSLQWAESGQYVANAASYAAFNAWSGGATPAGWLCTETVVARNTRGAAVQAVDALGRGTFNLYDTTDSRMVARFVNATAAQACYYGFESYERSGPWAYLGSSSIQSHITTAQYQTGTRSLQITPNGSAQSGPIANFLQTTSGDSYVFSCWMLTPTGFVADPTKARWTLQVYTTGAAPQPVGNPVVLGFPATNPQWQYLQAVVNLAAIKQAAGVAANTSVSVTILGCDNRANSVPVYVDDLCFAPLASQFSGNVFDVDTGLITATLGANGDTYRPIYDGGNRACASVGPGDQDIAWISMLAYARTMSPNGTYQPAFPNQAVNVSSASYGVYQNFDPADASQWTLPANWQVANNQLQFNGTSTDPIGSRATLTNFSQSNYAALVRVPTSPGSSTTVSIGTSDVFVSWTPGAGNGTWTLQQLVSGSWTSVATLPGSFAEQWLFAVVDQVVFFFADGAQIFGWRMNAPTQGKLQLAAKGSANFEQLVIAVDPGLSVTFIDGGGVTLATMAMVDNQTVEVVGQLFDSFGRSSYERQPVQQTVYLGTPAQSGGTSSPTTGLNEGALTTYLPYGGDGNQLTLAQYLDPAISDAPYVQTAFEPSPVGRAIEIGAPGASFTVGSGHSTQISYATNVASSWLSQVLPANAPGLAPGSYYRTAITSPDGHLIESITNQAGQRIARALTPSGATTPTSIESFQYDGAGRQVLHRQPNYYFPAGSTATTWVETATYDFTGNLTSTVDPDSGTTMFLSDSIGRPRFSMDAAAAALTPPVIRYVRYDTLDRIIERGVVSAAGLNWSGLAAHVNDQQWPAAGDGAIWMRRYFYDCPPTAGAYDAQPSYLVGRLAQSQINTLGSASPPAGSIDVYVYTYDQEGRVVQQDSTVPGFDSSTRRTQFAWDNQGRVIEISYPRVLVNGQPQGNEVKVTYFYDRIGRIAGIGTAPEGTEVLDPSNPNPGPMARYALYQYDSAGQLSSVMHALNSGGPIVQQRQYDTAGRPLAIQGDYFSQSFTYGTGGLGSTTNWSGRATSMTTAYAGHTGAVNDPASGMLGTRTWQYRYDPSGRLNGAVAGDAASNATLSAGTASTPIAFDANGVLLTVPRGPSTETYTYAAAPAQRTNDHIQQVAVTVGGALNLATPLPSGGWSFAASNAGPSTSQIVSTGTDAPYFVLGGGSLGHYEYLQWVGTLGQAERYTVTVVWRAPAPFATQSGIASCDLVLTSTQGTPYRLQLQDLSAGADTWQTTTLTIDMPSATTAAGLAGAIVSSCLQFRNAKCGTGGASGASLQIKSVTIARASDSATPTAYSYDAAGRITALPPRTIQSVMYNALSGQPDQFTFTAGGPVTSLTLTRGPADAVTTRTIAYSDGSALKTLQIRAPAGGLIASVTKDPSGTTTQTLYLRDQAQTFGTLPAAQGDPELYQIRDALGSLRAVAAGGQTAGLVQRIDYGPFGEQIYSTGASTSLERFTGQPWDDVTGLGDYNARFYDAQLRAFISPDAAGQSANSYIYAAGDPVNFSDATGNIAEAALIVGWAGYQSYRGYSLYQSGYITYAMENPGSFALDMAEMAVAGAAGSVVLMAMSPVLGPALGFYAAGVHWVLPYWVPAVSMTLGWLSGMYSAAVFGAVRTASEYYVRGRRDTLTWRDLGDAAITYGYEARYTALSDMLYSHFLAPRFRFPHRKNGQWKFVKSPSFGAAVVQTPGGKWIFRLSDGTYAFEEYAVSGGYILPFLQRGNPDMKVDTNRALALTHPYARFFRGWKYGNAAYKASGLVLEHRVQAGYYLFLQHAIHTPGRGGFAHVGISALIKKGLQYHWVALNAGSRAVDVLRSRKWTTESVIATEFVYYDDDYMPLGDDEL